jgi:UDP-N-acetylmuramoylalanine--D-glutamate ligase
VATFLKCRGAVLTIADTASDRQMGEAADRVREMGVRLEFGAHRTASFTQADLIVLSPGVPHTLAPIAAARKKGVPIIGEFELATRFIREPIIGVTGTNGKTTTAMLLGEMLKRSGKSVFVGGNIGNPLTGYVDAPERADWVVAEVSSFQLDTIETFRPRIGILLNITEDHLDRYDDFNAYGRSKGRMFINQGKDDIAVLNGADPMVSAVTEKIRSRKWQFAPDPAQSPGASVHAQEICFNTEDFSERLLLDCSRFALSGRHNRDNIAAASLATLAAGGNMAGIRSAIAAFKGLPHRLEYVSTRNGIRYVNDSKATNVDAVAKALTAFEAPIVLLMGGRDKGGDFKRLRDRIRRHVKHLVLFGEAAPGLEAALGRITPTETVPTMGSAILHAQSAAVPGDVVLLSPGCTSFDEFQSYEKRGDAFSKTVSGTGEGL